MDADMATSWVQIGHTKDTQHKVQKSPIFFHINMGILEFQVLGSEKPFIFQMGIPKPTFP